MMDSTHHVVFRSPYGAVTIQWAGDVLHSVALGPYAPFAGAQTEGAISEEAFPLLGLLNDYFSGVPVRFDVPIALEGHTHFERLVWTTARRIPYGEVRTYGWIASKIWKPGAARAVGGALGGNPFALVVPCHRVVGADGKLAGFRAGLEWKRALLNLEGIETDGERVIMSNSKV
jgi:methylated-DNA-[protein]-cysteine S-methyltransferase